MQYIFICMILLISRGLEKDLFFIRLNLEIKRRIVC